MTNMPHKSNLHLFDLFQHINQPILHFGGYVIAAQLQFASLVAYPPLTVVHARLLKYGFGFCKISLCPSVSVALLCTP